MWACRRAAPPPTRRRSATDEHGSGFSRLPRPGPGHPVGGALVSAVPDQRPRPRAHAGRARRGGRPRLALPLGAALRPGAREAGPPPPAAGPRAVARRRNLPPGWMASGASSIAPSPAPAGPSTACSAPRATSRRPSVSCGAPAARTTPATRGPSSPTGSTDPGARREMTREGELWRFTRHGAGSGATTWSSRTTAGSSAEPGRCSACRAFRPLGEPSPPSRPWRGWRRDWCRLRPGMTCRPSQPSSPAVAVAPRQRPGIEAQTRPYTSTQRNRRLSTARRGQALLPPRSGRDNSHPRTIVTDRPPWPWTKHRLPADNSAAPGNRQRPAQPWPLSRE